MSPRPSTEALRDVHRGPLSAVCAGISALVRERWGRGPKRSRAYWAGPDAMVVLLDDAYTDAERTLLGRGHGDQVLAGRQLLGEIAEPDLRRIVAEATGRPVRAVLFQASLEPAVSVAVLLFASESQDAPSGERLGDALRAALEQSSATRALIAESEQAGRQNATRRHRARETRERPPRDPPEASGA